MSTSKLGESSLGNHEMPSFGVDYCNFVLYCVESTLRYQLSFTTLDKNLLQLL